jgi:hypothetical protein
MSRGMWTKQYTSSGVPFFYNSTLNKSLWKPPVSEGGCVVHEAEYLKKPATTIENQEISLTQPQTQENNEINSGYNFQNPIPIPPIPPPIDHPSTNALQIQSTFEQPKQLNPNDEIAERLLQVTFLFAFPSSCPHRLLQVK